MICLNFVNFNALGVKFRLRDLLRVKQSTLWNSVFSNKTMFMSNQSVFNSVFCFTIAVRRSRDQVCHFQPFPTHGPSCSSMSLTTLNWQNFHYTETKVMKNDSKLQFAQKKLVMASISLSINPIISHERFPALIIVGVFVLFSAIANPIIWGALQWTAQ